MASLLRVLTVARPVALVRPASRLAASGRWQLDGIPRPRSILDDDDAPVDLSEDSAAVNGAHPATPPLHLRRPPEKPTPHEYKAHRETLRKAFPDGWAPPRKLSREAMDALRTLHHAEPATFTVPVLADRFRVSPEAVRRILKSKWVPSTERQTQLAIKERRQRQQFVRERAVKERTETRQVQKLHKLQREGYAVDASDEGDGGVSSADTFTFR